MHPEMPLRGRTIAVIGGDGRELEILRSLLAEGVHVRCFGCPADAEKILGRPQCGTLAAALNGVEAVVAPVPVIAPEGTFYAPESPVPLKIEPASFAEIGPGAVIVLGTSDPRLDEIAKQNNLRVVQYGGDDEMMIQRAPAIAEGAIARAIANTDFTLHDSRSLVVGFGRMGFAMTRTLLALGAHVTLAARNPAQRARAWELGARPIALSELATSAAEVDLVFNTVPALVITREVLARMQSHVFILDMAGAPGGTDFQAAAELKIKAQLGRGLGGRAPKTVGQSQWRGIRRLLLAELAKDT
jgi:dipicolinate synthase subunit A